MLLDGQGSPSIILFWGLALITCIMSSRLQSALNGGQPSFPMPPHMFPSFPSAPNVSAQLGSRPPFVTGRPSCDYPFQPPPSFVPPPPPAFEGSDDIASDQEALYSMLISWYMSGYHTGYYQVSTWFGILLNWSLMNLCSSQGLKQSAAQADSSKSKKSPSNQQRS